MEKDIETHTFLLTTNPQTFKLKNEIKNEEGTKRICVKNIQLEKKFFNILNTTEIEWGVKDNVDHSLEPDGLLMIGAAEEFGRQVVNIEETPPSLRMDSLRDPSLLSLFLDDYIETFYFLENKHKYITSWDINIKRIKLF